MRNLSAVLLVTTLIGAGGALPVRAQTAAAPPAPAPAAPMAPAPAAPPAANPPSPEAMAEEAQRKSEAADRAALFEAHLAALHAGLTLTPDQDKLWPPVEQAIRGFVSMRQALRAHWMEARKVLGEPGARPTGDHGDSDPVVALKGYSERMLRRAQALKALADAIDPLYAVLSEDQKHRIPLLLHDMGPRHGPVAKMLDRMGGMQDGQDEGPDRRGERADRGDWGGHGRGDRGRSDHEWGHHLWERGGRDRGRDMEQDTGRDMDHDMGRDMDHDTGQDMRDARRGGDMAGSSFRRRDYDDPPARREPGDERED